MDAPSVQYVTTSDGYSVAYAVSGKGHPLVFLPQPISHLQLYWTAETWVQPWFQGLAARFQFIQYDGRGQGMSSRGLRKDTVLSDLQIDLEAVVERTRLEHFLLMGVQQFGHVAIRYAMAHPERVDGLILVSCPATMASAPLLAIRRTPGQDWHASLRMAAGLSHAPDIAASVARQEKAINEGDQTILHNAWSESSIADVLGRLRTPTLVLHPSESLNLAPEESMRLAAAIPDARMVLIKGNTPLGEAEDGLTAIEEFVGGLPLSAATSTAHSDSPDGLSQREMDVLRLLGAGRTNQQIASDLLISLNTVRRHVSNIFDKTGATNRAQVAIYARDHGLV